MIGLGGVTVIKIRGTGVTVRVALPEIPGVLVSEIESECGLELIPSMPTPEELQALYDWDRRLSSGDEAWTKEASSCS